MTSIDQARLLIERAESLRDTLEDPLVLFSVLYGLWNATYIAFNGEALRELSVEILTLAEKQGTPAPLMIGHRLDGKVASTVTRLRDVVVAHRDVAAAQAHFDHAIALYDPAAHRSLTPPGAPAISDPVDLTVTLFGSLAVSVFLPEVTPTTTMHWEGVQTAYIAAGRMRMSKRTRRLCLGCF
jgi:hypothetical protein